MAAVPIKVRMIRRERFMMVDLGWVCWFGFFEWDDRAGHSGMRAAARQVKVQENSWHKPVTSRHRAAQDIARYQPPEKCADSARANEPKPPRLTLLEPESEVPDDEWFDAESLLKKLLRDQVPPDEPPWPPPQPCDWQSAPACAPGGMAMPGWFGSQLPRGMNAAAPPPTARVPISSRATWPERFTGADWIGWLGAGRRRPNSLRGLSAMLNRSSRPR
jgi:hypothetical protein